MLKIVQLVEPSWAPTEISCISEASPDRVQAIESLGAKPLFNQSRTAFKIPASMLALPYKGQRCKPDSPSSEENDRWLSDPSDTLAGSVKQVIRAYSGDRWLSALEVSEVAGTSLRTLQRRLSLESTSFSILLEEVRGELAVDLLENTDASISEIAAHLGYEDQANFSRAFRRWAGVSPTLFRSQRGARQE
jgi:AraC-like DNA-binding protein